MTAQEALAWTESFERRGRESTDPFNSSYYSENALFFRSEYMRLSALEAEATASARLDGDTYVVDDTTNED